MSRHLKLGALLTLAMTCCALIGSTTVAQPPANLSGKNVAPPVVPKIYGKTIGEWSAAWWLWVFQFPAETSPFFAEGEVDCAMEQSGKVWFLAGNFGDTSTRTCTIPKNKSLFFPIVNYVGWGPDDAPVACCPPDGELEGCACFDGGDPRDCPDTCFEAVREQAFMNVDGATDLVCTVDNVPVVYHNQMVRAQSPNFVLSIAEGGLFGPVDYPVAISDGYWVMLPPLSPGEHVLNFAAVNGDFVLDVTYNLTIE